MVIEHAKYPPVGKRGVSTMRAHTFYDPKELKPYVEAANNRVEIYAEIETRKGVDNAEAILALDGVTGAIIGPNDLSMDYGVIGSPINDYVMDAIKKVGAIATTLKKVTGIITSEEILINHSKKCGFDLYCLGSELSLLKKAGSNLVSTFKKGV
jgi:2-keto-3-deoxy-L-rhamnonate aldolase RhmA